MPSKLRAGAGFPYIMEADRGEVTEPQFTLRVLSADDSDALVDLRNEYTSTDDDKKKRQIRNQMLGIAVVECKVSSEPVSSILTDLECWEVITAATAGAMLTADERKKFVSPPLSETGNCASDAAASA